MTILLQDRRTERYFQQTHAWVENAREAFYFTCSDDALRVQRELQLTDAALVFRFEETGHAISVPLDCR